MDFLLTLIVAVMTLMIVYGIIEMRERR